MLKFLLNIDFVYIVSPTDAPSTTQREHCERQESVEASAPSDDGMELQGQRGPNEATTHFADFMYNYMY